MSANRRTNEPADQVSGAADPAGPPSRKPIDAVAGSLPYGEAARSGDSQSCSGIRPAPDAKLLIETSSAVACEVTPVARPFSARSADRTGHRWPVPVPVVAQGWPSADPSP